MRRRALIAAVAAGATGVACVVVAPAGATVSVRVVSVRVVAADTRTPVSPPYRRTRAHAYVVRYRVSGEPLMRVTRRAEIRTPQGTLIARVAPPTSVDEPGLYFATSRIPVGARDPRTTYVLRYAVTVRGQRGRRTAVRVVRLPFR